MDDDPGPFSSESAWDALIRQEGLTRGDADAFRIFCFANNLDPDLSSLDMLEDLYREWRKDVSA